jgi:hypothetical protein
MQQPRKKSLEDIIQEERAEGFTGSGAVEVHPGEGRGEDAPDTHKLLSVAQLEALTDLTQISPVSSTPHLTSPHLTCLYHMCQSFSLPLCN